MWFEQFESRAMLATVPYGATLTDTGEYMLGDVNVSVVLLESTGPAGATNSENWTEAAINSVKTNINTGLQWWVDTLHKYYPDAYLNFHTDFTYADHPFEISGYEPINNTSNQHTLFVQDFLAAKGFYSTGGNINAGIYEYNNSQRIANGTDWSYTIFVVNDANDIATDPIHDGKFAYGGSFDKSFAYPGGRYFVTLADRPAEIIAHETGHIFWAVDEYSSGDSYYEKRGYYNTQNLNGAAGAPPGFQQQDSLMASNSRLTNSYLNKTLPASTREMIGWKDSDGDGIIDVLDVPLTLSGNGFRDAQGNYRFIGQSKVQTLPNLNPYSPAQSDITLNRIRVAEYRLDGAAWITAANYETFDASLDLTIPLPSGQHTIEIRTRDTLTGVTSAIFSASTQLPSSVVKPGINGFVWNDRDNDGVLDADESAVGGRTIQLVNSSGQPLAGPTIVEPTNFAPEAYLGFPAGNIQLAAQGNAVENNLVIAWDGTYGGTSSRMFGNYSRDGVGGVPSTLWYNDRKLKITFTSPVAALSIDAIGVNNGSFGRLEVYDASNNLLGRFTSSELALGAVQKLLVSRPQADIKYALVFGNGGTVVALDNLSVGPQVTTTTNAYGSYSFNSLAAGTYYVRVDLPAGWTASNPTTSTRQTTLTAGQSLVGVDFGQHSAASPWRNQQIQFDVNGDGEVTPLDALLVIIDLNAAGPRVLTDPPASGETPPNLIDVNGDGILSPLDALDVIIYLNASGSSEPPAVVSGGAGGVGNGSGAPPQGEIVAAMPLNDMTKSAAEFIAISGINYPGPTNPSLTRVADWEVSSPASKPSPRLTSDTTPRPSVIRNIVTDSVDFGAAGSTCRRSRFEHPFIKISIDEFLLESPFSTIFKSNATPMIEREFLSYFNIPVERDEALWNLLSADVAAARAENEEAN